jgi:hypothetical protein
MFIEPLIPAAKEPDTMILIGLEGSAFEAE